MESRSIEDLFGKLSRSKFRSRFHLKETEKKYVHDKGMDVIREHAISFIDKKLAPDVIINDGKQTPMKGHPVFIAQHATACCCRGCIYKWHSIPIGRKLTEKEKGYILDVVMKWIAKEMDGYSPKEEFTQMTLNL